VLQTKVTVLENTPMEIIVYNGMHDLKNVDYRLDPNYVSFFNHIDHQYSNPYVNSIELADKPT
jgi:hypothetical protein